MPRDPGPGRQPRRAPQAQSPAPPLPDATRVDPAALTALLVRHGWVRHGGARHQYARWSPPDDREPDTSLLIPAHRGFEDAQDLVEEALATLAASAVPSAAAILAALAVPGDEIRWRRELPGAGGAVPWAAEEELRGAADAMLTAAAKAARARAAYFGSRLDGQAREFLERVLVAAPGTGAGLLTAYLPVPDGRPATGTLVRGLEAVRDAVDYRRATGRLDAFESGVRVGVSQELVEAVRRLVRGSEGAEVALAWSVEAGPPHGFGGRSLLVEFTPGDLPALEEAADLLVHSEPAVDVVITGAVVRLKRPAAGGEGQIRLAVLEGADVAEVRVRLDDEDYRTAVEAHLAGVPIRLAGRLERKGGFRRLVRPHGLAPAPLDETERERMLKRLRDGGE
jgi:hypothetical protein